MHKLTEPKIFLKINIQQDASVSVPELRHENGS